MIACQTHRAVMLPSRTTAVDRDIIHRTPTSRLRMNCISRSTRNPRGDIRNALKSGRNMLAFRPRHTARRHPPHAVGTVVGYARGYCLNAPAEALSSLSAASSAESVSNRADTHMCWASSERRLHPLSPSAGSYHSGPETVGAAYIIAACSHYMCTETGTTIRSVRRKPLDKLLNHTRHTPRMYRKHPHRGPVGSRWLSRMGIVNLTAIMRHISMPRAFRGLAAAARELPCPEK